ncbi:MAG: hypothetical protein LIO51_03525, partial [Clostridiales bacterium]|nr:hypothetical protein [Clostridiales bacterium]
MRANADVLLDEPMPEANEELFSLAETTGNRLAYERIDFQRRGFLAVDGGLALFQGEPNRLEKLEEVI